MAEVTKVPQQTLRALKVRVDRYAREPITNIFLFEHVRTKQVVYSLSRDPIRRTSDTNKFLKSITFMGKKTVPAEYRIDMWKPMATVTFHSEFQCLDALQKLREFRLKRDYAWRQNGMAKGVKDMKLSQRKKWLMDQKANSVADLAATLMLQAKQVKLAHGEFRKNLSRQQEWTNYPKKLFKKLDIIAKQNGELTEEKVQEIVAEATRKFHQRSSQGKIRDRHTKFWTQTCQDSLAKLKKLHQLKDPAERSAIFKEVIKNLSVPIANQAALESRDHAALLDIARRKVENTKDGIGVGRLRRWINGHPNPGPPVDPTLNPSAERMVREHLAGKTPPAKSPMVAVTWGEFANKTYVAQDAWPMHVVHDEYASFQRGIAPIPFTWPQLLRTKEEVAARKEREEELEAEKAAAVKEEQNQTYSQSTQAKPASTWTRFKERFFGTLNPART